MRQLVEAIPEVEALLALDPAIALIAEGFRIEDEAGALVGEVFIPGEPWTGFSASIIGEVRRDHPRKEGRWVDASPIGAEKGSRVSDVSLAGLARVLRHGKLAGGPAYPRKDAWMVATQLLADKLFGRLDEGPPHSTADTGGDRVAVGRSSTTGQESPRWRHAASDHGSSCG